MPFVGTISPGAVPPGRKYIRWDEATSQPVETTEDDPKRIMFKDEIDRAIMERVFLSTFLGLAGGLLIQRLFKRAGK